MKLYKYIICGGLALTLTLSSCESWLDPVSCSRALWTIFHSSLSGSGKARVCPVPTGRIMLS